MLRASSSSIRVLAARRESCITKDVAESNLKRNQKSGFSLDTNVIRSSDERVTMKTSTLLTSQMAILKTLCLASNSRFGDYITSAEAPAKTSPRSLVSLELNQKLETFRRTAISTRRYNTKYCLDIFPSMGILILPPSFEDDFSAPLPENEDYDSDGDASMLEDGARLSKRMKLTSDSTVVPGEQITDEPQWMRYTSLPSNSISRRILK